MELTPEQEKLFNDLLAAAEDNTNIEEILESATTDDLFAVFRLEEGVDEHSVIKNSFLYDLMGNEERKFAIFNMVKKRGVLKRFLNIDLFVKNGHDADESCRVAEAIVKCDKGITVALDNFKDIFGLREFLEALSEVDRNIIKGALEKEMEKLGDDQEKSKYENYLEEIKTIESKQELNTIILRERRLDFGDNRESRKEAAKKGMKFGAIGGAITALAVGLGLYFGTGAALTALPTIIGIALVAALLVGATIYAITYDVLKPKSCVDTVRVFKEFDTIKQEANTAAM